MNTEKIWIEIALMHSCDGLVTSANKAILEVVLTKFTIYIIKSYQITGYYIGNNFIVNFIMLGLDDRHQLGSGRCPDTN